MDELRTTVQQGRYEATLRIGGWSPGLTWTFPGPDRRYRDGYATIPLHEIADFRQAIGEAYEHLNELKVNAPPGVEIVRTVKIGLFMFELRVGSEADGVRPFPRAEHSYQCVVRNRKDFKDFDGLLASALAMSDTLKGLAADTAPPPAPTLTSSTAAAESELPESAAPWSNSTADLATQHVNHRIFGFYPASLTWTCWDCRLKDIAGDVLKHRGHAKFSFKAKALTWSCPDCGKLDVPF
ncbi:hypothetical protein [Krasilnikovia sp. MM14-A1004]|uniref:hypothetical protein n=1 Tax=Krasilnikovia sp. MM14-A1004 TaxID=3373541 RepID=UPI00399CAE3C